MAQVALQGRDRHAVIGTLGGGAYPTASDINSAGGIVGMSNAHAFYAPGNSMIDLGTLGGSDSAAKALNSGGQVVGNSTNGRGETRAFVFTNGKMYGLNKLVDYMPDVLWDAIAINTSGQIVVLASTYNYLLTPR